MMLVIDESSYDALLKPQIHAHKPHLIQNPLWPYP